MINNSWKVLYKIAAIASLISAALIPVAGYFFFMYPPTGFDPTYTNTLGWFKLFSDNWLAGLFNLDLVMVIDNILVIPVFLSLYLILRKTNETLTLIGLIIGLIGIATYFAINPAFSMLSLSRQYALATENKDTLIAAGQTLLAIYQGTGFVTYLMLASATGILMGIVMLQGKIFSRITAWSGILGNLMAPAMFLPVVGLYIGFLSLIPLIIWYILIALKLFKMGTNLKNS
jgi:hypothetical protein